MESAVKKTFVSYQHAITYKLFSVFSFRLMSGETNLRHHAMSTPPER